MSGIRQVLLAVLLLAQAAASAIGFEETIRRAAGDSDLSAQESPPEPAAAAERPCLEVAIRRSALGETSYRSYGTRYLVSELQFHNTCDHALNVPVTDLHLQLNGQELSPQFQLAPLRTYSFECGKDSFRFRDLTQHTQLTLSPAEAKTTWVIFTGLPRSGRVPDMVLHVSVDDVEQRLSVNDHHRRTLDLSVQRIGPRGVLGWLTIAGALDTINVGVLVEQLDHMSNQGVSRAVVSFADSAAPVASPLVDWLEHSAYDREKVRLLNQFPTFPPLIEELHVAAVPGADDEAFEIPGGRPHVHRTAAAAIEWALEPLFRSASSDEIVEQFEHGHPLVRAAALATGGAQLSAEYLPMVLEFAASGDPLLQRGALLALSESGHPQAIDHLVQHARSGSVRLATLAVECLAASRFPSAHAALAELLSQPLSVSLADLTRTLSQYPRVRWNDALRRIASGDWRDADAPHNEQIEVRRDALTALGRIGHPELVDVLAGALRSDHEPIRATAFGLLVKRTDRASERLAVDYAVEKTRNGFPSQEILLLFRRTRDPQAVPVLIGHLNTAHPNRRQLIQTLADAGHSTIDETLVAHYDEFNPDEQATVLASLQHLGSVHSFPFAKQAIDSPDRSLFRQAVSTLQMLESPEAVAVLSDTLFETTEHERSRLLSSVLVQIGTNEAYRALHRAVYVDDPDKVKRIRETLAGFYQRSPGFPHLYDARGYSSNEQWQEAEQAYNQALELDPELLEAYSGRGQCRLYLEKIAQARSDFERVLCDNPFDSQAVTGIGIALARAGDVEEAIHIVDEGRGRFPHDWVFAYNAACVYGRAIEATLQEPQTEDRDSRIAQLQQQALDDLRLSVERGCDEFEFMRRDPDLAPLRDLEEFQKLAAPSVEPRDP